MTPKKLCEMADNGNKNAILIWEEFGSNLGMVLSHFINLIDLHRISIGGGISNAFELFSTSMREMIKANSPSYNKFEIEIFESKHKELSSQLGAALLVKGYH